MTRKLPLKKISLFCLAAILLGLFFVSSSTYAGFIVNLALKTVDKSKIDIHVSNPRFTWGGIGAGSMLIRPKNFPLSVIAKDVSISLSFRSLIRGAFILRSEAVIYNGQTQALFSPFSEKLSLRFDDLELHQSPPLQGFSVRSAFMSGEILEFDLNSSSPIPQLKRFTVTLSRLEKDFSTTLPPYLTGLPMELTIPEIHYGKITLSGTVNPEGTVVAFSDIDTESSLFSLKGDGSYTKSGSGRGSAKLDLEGTLAKGGFEIPELVTVVKLFSKSQINKPRQPFRFTLDGALGPVPPKMNITPINPAEGQE